MKFTFPPESRPLTGITIKRAIHRGGFGEVYYAITDAGREVALKLLQHHQDVELRGIQQCLNLSHPHLITIFDVRQDQDGDHWVVMEYIAGQTLDKVIRSYPEGMPVELIRQWLTGLTSGIEFLHRRGIVHRDLKPANLFLQQGVVKIGDVGLSKLIGPRARSAQTQSVGTVYYMAPEIANGSYGQAVDIYAIGIMLYEMVTGDVPFDGESTGEILLKQLTQSPDLSRVPERLRPVIACALQKSPQARFPDGRALQQAFEAAVTGKAVPVTEFPAAEASPGLGNTTARPDPAPGVPKQHQLAYRLGRALHPIPLPVLLLLPICVWALEMFRSGRHFSIFNPAFLIGIGVAYFILRHRKHKQQPEHHSAPVVETPQPAPVVPKPVPSVAARHRPDLYLPDRPVQSRPASLSQLTGSAALLVPLTAVLSGIVLFVKPTLFHLNLDARQPDWMPAAFFAMSALIAAWGALILSRVKQRAFRQGLSGFQRWPDILIGAGIGGCVWGLGQYLLITLPTTGDAAAFALFNSIGDHRLILRDQGPSLAGFLTFFTCWFILANPGKWGWLHRRRRFSLMSVFAGILLAWITTGLFAFPIPWALAWGTVVSCIVQLASPWMEPRRLPR